MFPRARARVRAEKIRRSTWSRGGPDIRKQSSAPKFTDDSAHPRAAHAGRANRLRKYEREPT